MIRPWSTDAPAGDDGFGRTLNDFRYTQSKRALRTGSKDARPLEAEVEICWAEQKAKDGPQRQGRKGTLGEGARPY